MQDVARLARIFKALADPNRLAILTRLWDCCGPSCCEQPKDEARTVSEIASQLDLAMSTVSHHLKELREVGLIVCERRGQSVYCFPDLEMIKKLKGFLGT